MILIGRGRALGLAALACIAIGAGAGATAAQARAAAIVDLPVSFGVRNVNRSLATCPADGRKYTVRGHLTVSRRTIARHGLRGAGGVTLYLHGSLIGEPVWRSRIRGYNWARRMAAAGHPSVTVDQLGFGASGAPDGLDVCVGSWADAAHQVIAQLRRGAYRIGGRRRAARFARVVLASYCFGGLIAQVEAYSFKDVDGFVMLSSAFDQGYTPAAAADLFARPDGPAAVCSRGGERKRASGPPHYAYVFKGTERARWFHDADPRLVAAVVHRHEREPCGEGPSTAPALAADQAHLRDIAVPVLLVFGRRDAVFGPDAGERQLALFAGSRDAKLVEIPRSGHALQLERTAPLTRVAVARWLAARGLD